MIKFKLSQVEKSLYLLWNTRNLEHLRDIWLIATWKDDQMSDV